MSERIQTSVILSQKGSIMKLAIIGATGGSGRHFLDLATAAGHSVRALARTPSKLTDVAEKVEVHRADGTDEASLVTALSPGFDAVVSIVGASTLLQARRVSDLYSVTTKNLINAVQKTRSQRLIVVSSSGVEPQDNDNWFYVHILKRFFLGAMYQDMLRMEALLKGSALDYTIVRPPYLTRGAPTGTYRISEGKNFTDDKTLRRGDLAHALLAVAEQPEAYRRTMLAVSE